MRLSFRTRLYIGFTIAILLSAISGLTSYKIFQKQKAQRLWVKRARYALDSAKSIEHLMVNMETGRRGFRATNEKKFLEPYAKSLQQIDITLPGLKNLLTDDSEQENRAILLEEHIHTILRFWKGNGDDASTYTRDYITVLTSTEKMKMDSIRGILTELELDENKLLIKRRAEYDALIHDSALSSGIDSVLCEMIIVILIIFIFREFRIRRKVQDQLKESVTQLQKQTVSLQTSEEELKDALKEVEVINKQLEKFVYTVAHDIKSPLAGISGSLSILETEKEITDNPELAEFVHLSYERSLHLSDMVNSILEYSRMSLSQQQIDTVDTRNLVEQIIKLMFPPAHIRIAVAGEMPVFKTKRIKILEVFQNLISNAIKYNNKKQGYIEIGCTDKGDYYEFYVKDNGQGIREEDKYKVFELMNTGHSKTQRETSTGFGLSIVKLIIEEQGGKIWVDSVPGEGSTFYFEWKK